MSSYHPRRISVRPSSAHPETAPYPPPNLLPYEPYSRAALVRAFEQRSNSLEAGQPSISLQQLYERLEVLVSDFARRALDTVNEQK